MQVGNKVRGIYCGQTEFSGTIESMRALTVPTDGAFQYFVRLDRPTLHDGEAREVLVVHAKFDGSATSYVRHGDYMQLA